MQTLQEKLDELISKLTTKQPKELSSDDPLLDENWNASVSSIKILTEALELIKEVPTSLPPIGSPYIRCPGMLPPWEQFQATKKAEWIEIHKMYPGDFMRLAGGNASKFKSGSATVSYDSTVKGGGGGQIDALQEHKHEYTYVRADQWSQIKTKHGGGWRAEKWVTTNTKDANCRTTLETRPKNFTIELYVYKGK